MSDEGDVPPTALSEPEAEAPRTPDPLDPDSTSLEALLPRPAQPKEVWKAVAIVAVLVLALVGFGWYAGWFTNGNAAARPNCPNSLTLQGYGSPSLAPLVGAWAETLGRSSGCYQVGFHSSGGAAGVSAFLGLRAQYLATDSPLNASEWSSAPYPVVTMPAAVEAVAVVYHVPGITSGLRLNASVLAGMYLGDIRSWNDPRIAALNPGLSLPSGVAVVPIHQDDFGGTTRVVSEYLARSNSTWNSSTAGGADPEWGNQVGDSNDSSLVSEVLAQAGAVGYAALAAALTAGAPCASLESPDGSYVSPSIASAVAAAPPPASLPAGNQSWAGVSLLDSPAPGAYPLAAFVYLVTYEDLGTAFGSNMSYGQADWLAYFFYWAGLHGQNSTTPLSFASIPAAQSTADIQILEMLTYHGVHLVSDVDHDGDGGGLGFALPVAPRSGGGRPR